MRANIPTPVVIGILVVVLIGLVVAFWKGSGPKTAANEDLIRNAFSVKRPTGAGAPSPPGMRPGMGPGGAGPSGAPAPPAGSR
ncbi:MAG: hypothetical protein GX446_14075 [Chthonomonadales bacterium]|nr:hypothetical protein [Chthonomonadales bacterium]